MINTERLQMEISDILNDYTGEQLEVLMAENGLNSNDTYNPESNTNKKNVNAGRILTMSAGRKLIIAAG